MSTQNLSLQHQLQKNNGSSAGHIIVVDDEDAVRHTLSLILTHAGYQVTGFSDGFSFINDKGLKPDCVVLDLSMPGLSGIDLLRGRPHQVCKIFKTAHPPLQRPRIRIIMVRLQV